MGREEHLDWGTKDQQALMTTFRANSCSCAGNKTARAGATLQDTTCTNCDNKDSRPENELHILIECLRYAVFRAIMEMQLRENWGENRWRVYEEATKDEKRRTLLGSRDLIDGGKEERRRRDLAVKEFIQEVNTYRKEILGLPDLRGAFYQPQEASLEEARDWERQLEEELQE